MKRILPLLAAMIALTTVLPGKAQTGKYYIDGRETTREELLKLPAGTIESMANSVENGLPVVRIKLKPEGEEQAPATGQQEKNTATPHEKAMQLVRGIYEQHTLLKEGDLAADFRATKYAGGDLTLTTLRGKVVLLNFWATWCGPCLRELAPEALPKIILERFAADSEFVFLPVAYTDSKESLDKFFAGDEQQNYAYLRDLTAMDPDKRVFGLYAEQGVPRSFVIDRNGRIVLGSLGAAQEELERIAAAIEKELSR